MLIVLILKVNLWIWITKLHLSYFVTFGVAYSRIVDIQEMCCCFTAHITNFFCRLSCLNLKFHCPKSPTSSLTKPGCHKLSINQQIMNLTFCGSVNKNRPVDIYPAETFQWASHTNIKVMVAKREVGTHWEY